MRPSPHPNVVGTLVLLACVHGYLALKTTSPAVKIQRLLLDIRQSTGTASEDADLVFATLDSYTQQLEASIENEIGGLNRTLSSLIAERANFAKDAAASENEIRTLGASLEGTQHVATSYEQGSGDVEKKFDNILGSLDGITHLLQNAAVAPNGVLVTSEEDTGSTKVLDAVRHLLQVHSTDLATQYKDVLGLFKGNDAPHFTPLLLSRTISALLFVKRDLHGREVQALGQFEARVQKYSSDATATSASIAEQRGMQAEKALENEEIFSSIAFTKTVLKRDINFMDLLSASDEAKRATVSKIRDLRSKEHRILQDLVDILGGKYAVKNPEAPALLQTSMRVRKYEKNPKGISNLQTYIEEGIHDNVDLHALLMKVKASLTQSSSNMDAENVQGIVASLQTVLKDVEAEQSKADEVKRKCDNQMYRSKEEVQALKANIALINMAGSHTAKAIHTVKQSIRGIAKKTNALAESAKDCEKMYSQSMRTLEQQARDRSTILVAISRAAQVAEHSDLATSPVVTLLKQLLDTTQEHEIQERNYRNLQLAFKKTVEQYFHEYSQSLKERGGKYEDTLAALELHMDEIADDEASQKDSLVSSTELDQEDKNLCQGVIHAYDNHSKRRLELVSLLKRMIPKVPEILNIEARTTA